MNFESNYKLDNTVSDGVWRTLRSGMKVKVASIRNPSYVTALHRLRKEYADEIRSNDKAIVNKLTNKAVSTDILLDWKNVTDTDNNPLQYTPEIGEQMLEKYEIFKEEVLEISADDSNYLVGDVIKK